MYLTCTLAGVCFPTFSVPGTVFVSTFVTVTVTPSGNPLRFLAAFSASSLIAFSNSVLSLFFGTTTPSGLTFGNTVTGTGTISSRLLTPEPYVTVTGAVNVSSPTFPVVSGSLVSSTVFSFPLVVTASFNFSEDGLSPSTT